MLTSGVTEFTLQTFRTVYLDAYRGRGIRYDHDARNLEENGRKNGLLGTESW